MEKRTKKSTSSNKIQKKTQSRLSPEERQLMILEGAVSYFAKFGFDGRTRGLAKYLGISQPLIYRYFPTMASLTDRVYEVVFIDRWHDSWQQIISDRTIPLSDRLKAFYKDYHHSINRYDTLRITMFSALRGETISARYFKRIIERLIKPIIIEFRDIYDLKKVDELPLHPLEEEIVFSLHAKVIYPTLRKFVFQLPTAEQESLLIDIYIDSFMAGAEDSFRRIHEFIES